MQTGPLRKGVNPFQETQALLRPINGCQRRSSAGFMAMINSPSLPSTAAKYSNSAAAQRHSARLLHAQRASFRLTVGQAVTLQAVACAAASRKLATACNASSKFRMSILSTPAKVGALSGEALRHDHPPAAGHQPGRTGSPALHPSPRTMLTNPPQRHKWRPRRGFGRRAFA
jgi:hypothetical protein